MKFKDKNGNTVEFNKYEASLLRGRGETLTPIEEAPAPKAVVEEKPVASKKKKAIKVKANAEE